MRFGVEEIVVGGVARTGRGIRMSMRIVKVLFLFSVPFVSLFVFGHFSLLLFSHCLPISYQLPLLQNCAPWQSAIYIYIHAISGIQSKPLTLTCRFCVAHLKMGLQNVTSQLLFSWPNKSPKTLCPSRFIQRHSILISTTCMFDIDPKNKFACLME